MLFFRLFVISTDVGQRMCIRIIYIYVGESRAEAKTSTIFISPGVYVCVIDSIIIKNTLGRYMYSIILL